MYIYTGGYVTITLIGSVNWCRLQGNEPYYANSSLMLDKLPVHG